MEEFKKNWEDKDLFGFLSEGVFSMKILNQNMCILHTRIM